MRRPPIVHYGVPDTDGYLVPWCEAGGKAWAKNMQVAVNPLPAQADCAHCRKHLDKEKP